MPALLLLKDRHAGHVALNLTEPSEMDDGVSGPLVRKAACWVWKYAQMRSHSGEQGPRQVIYSCND